MLWLGVCYKGLIQLVIIEEGGIDSSRCVEEILPIVLEDGKKMLANEFIFQHDNRPAHHHSVKNAFMIFGVKLGGLQTTPILILLNTVYGKNFVNKWIGIV